MEPFFGELGVLAESDTNLLAGNVYHTKTYISFYAVGYRTSWKGAIDEVRIYNYSLSPAQIKALYENRTDLIVSQETSLGDVWQACITPNDGYGDGNTTCSNNLTIIKPLPIQDTPILNSTFGLNSSVENLTVYNVSTSDLGNDTLFSNF